MISNTLNISKDCKVFVCQTVYHLYQALLIGLTGEGRFSLVITDFTPGMINLISKIKEIDRVVCVYYVENELLEKSIKSKSFFHKVVFLIRYRDNLIARFDSNYELLYEIAKKSEVYLFVDKSFIAHYFILINRNVILLDDGEGNYFAQKKTLGYFLKHYFFNIPKNLGRSGYIKKIMYRYPDRVPEKIRSIIGMKLHELDISSYEKKLSLSDKYSILSVFDMNRTNLTKTKKCLIFTQPFSEDGFISEKRKLSIYNDIVIKSLQSGYDVYIKPHPRELTDYSVYFDSEQVSLISNAFPSEVFNLLGTCKFEKGVAIQSTALSNASYIIDKKELGYESYPDLKEGKEKLDNVAI